MNGKKKSSVLSILGLAALLVACVIGVQAVFIGLGMVIPNEARTEGDAYQSQSASASVSGATAQAAPSFCPFCGESLPSAFQWGQFCPYCGEQVNE